MTAIIELSKLREVELREVWPTEDKHFTPWLAEEENLTQLGETLVMELELEAQEVPVGDFHADILCKNEDDSWVVIENQLEEANHKHLGQILTYAAGLDAHTVIWIAKKFRDEHRAALNQLNEITDERFRYFGIEIKVWQIGDSARAPQFEIVCSPNNWSRTVSRDTERTVNKNLSETRQLKKKYWSALRDSMDDKDTQVKWQKPGHWNTQNFSIGRAGFTLVARQNSRDNFIATILVMSKPNAKEHFNLLKEQQQDIEEEFGEELEWEEKPDHEESHILLQDRETDPTNETDWPNQQKWFADNLEKFDKVFRPRVKALNADDWEPPEAEDDA